MTTRFRPCVLIPTYDNAQTVRQVVLAVRAQLPHVIVVDDGSGARARAVVAALMEDQLATVLHLPANGGKGAAVKAGFAQALSMGFSHALQIDADGQHDLQAISPFLAAAELHPDALVLARPIFDKSAPRLRKIAREFTNLWVTVETQNRSIRDAMVGFRVYPLAKAVAADARSNRMDFDIEIAVRMVWHGTPVLNLPLAVRYLAAHEGGISHFHPWRDNIRITLLHTRLVIESLLRAPLSRWKWGHRLPEPA